MTKREAEIIEEIVRSMNERILEIGWLVKSGLRRVVVGLGKAVPASGNQQGVMQ